MRSRRAAARAAAAAAWLAALVAMSAGCGGSVHDASVGGEPLVTVRGHVDVAALERVHPEAPLLGALVWAAVPTVNPVCVAFDEPALAGACPDPYGVFYGPLEHAAPIDGDGNFALPLYHLPKASVSVGDEVTRIAWASLIVVEDVDGNGEASLLAAINPTDGRQRDDGEPPPLSPTYDVIVASSFHSLRAPQARLAFREGGFVQGSYFYPAPGCAPPPPGFSILHAPPYGDPPTGACTTASVDVPVTVTPLGPAESKAFACRSVQRSARLRQPRADEPPSDKVEPICLSDELFAVVFPGTCQRVRAYALKGCANDPFCSVPEWDQTPRPPSWWPCP